MRFSWIIGEGRRVCAEDIFGTPSGDKRTSGILSSLMEGDRREEGEPESSRILEV